jgi:hypothetical protein
VEIIFMKILSMEDVCNKEEEKEDKEGGKCTS